MHHAMPGITRVHMTASLVLSASDLHPKSLTATSALLHRQSHTSYTSWCTLRSRTLPMRYSRQFGDNPEGFPKLGLFLSLHLWWMCSQTDFLPASLRGFGTKCLRVWKKNQHCSGDLNLYAVKVTGSLLPEDFFVCQHQI